MKLKVGQQFEHKHWMRRDQLELRPLVGKVTKRLGDGFYWRPVDGGSSGYVRDEETDRYVARLL